MDLWKKYSLVQTCKGFLIYRGIRVATCLLILIPSIPTWRHVDLWVRISLSPSQPQLEKSPNQKSKHIHNQRMGWENLGAPHPHKEKKAVPSQPIYSSNRMFMSIISYAHIKNNYLKFLEIEHFCLT